MTRAAVLYLIGWISLLAGISPAVGKHADARFTDRDLLVADSFTYDLAGQIAEQKEITYLWDGWDLLYERHQTPGGLPLLERRYLWGEGLSGSGREMNSGGLLLIRETKGNTTTDLIPLYDGGGNVIALTDLTQTLHASYAYGPFGERISATGPRAQGNPWRWATKYLDEETGLYYFGHRYYDPVTGQWLSREPLGESESLNLYSYCHNDPVNKVDRLGLDEVIVNGGMVDYHFVSEVNGARGGWLKKLMDHVFLAKFDGSERKFAGKVALGSLSGENVILPGGISIPLSDLQTMADGRSMGHLERSEQMRLLTGDLNSWIARNEGAGASKLAGAVDKIVSAPFQALAGPDALTILGGVADKHNGFSFGVDLGSRNYVRGIHLGSEIDDGIQVASIPLLLNPRNAGTLVRGARAVEGGTALRQGVLTNIAQSQQARASSGFAQVSRRWTAMDFYESAGWPSGRIQSHLGGIDFSRPVTVRTLPAGSRVAQYQIPGAPVGNYFAPIGVPGSRLGIYTGGRTSQVFEETSDVRVLQSTAGGVIDDWSVPFWKVQTDGGGMQFFAPNPHLFRLVE